LLVTKTMSFDNLLLASKKEARSLLPLRWIEYYLPHSCKQKMCPIPRNLQAQNVKDLFKILHVKHFQEINFGF